MLRNNIQAALSFVFFFSRIKTGKVHIRNELWKCNYNGNDLTNNMDLRKRYTSHFFHRFVYNVDVCGFYLHTIYYLRAHSLVAICDALRISIKNNRWRVDQIPETHGSVCLTALTAACSRIFAFFFVYCLKCRGL